MELIRSGTPSDFQRINEIYNWTIVNNHVSFDTEPYDLVKRRRWWDERASDLDFLVAEIDGCVMGICYSSYYRPKPAYRSSLETTIVLDTSALRIGLGSRLLRALLDRLIEKGVHTAVAIVALPNDGSIALHHKLGYRSIGVLHEVGTKYDRFWDTEIFQKQLTS